MKWYEPFFPLNHNGDGWKGTYVAGAVEVVEVLVSTLFYIHTLLLTLAFDNFASTKS